MISYINEILDMAKLPLDEIKNKVTISCVGGNILVINNYIKILSYSIKRIVLKIKDNELIVEGDNITIKQLDNRDISLVGNFARISFANEVKKYVQVND